MNEDHTVKLLFKILCALSFIHQANIIHRDIKPGNLLVNSECEVFLCDFGLARTLPKIDSRKKDYSRKEMARKLQELKPGRIKKRRQLSPHVVTRHYRPPEIILLEKTYKPSVDLWSTGCILA